MHPAEFIDCIAMEEGLFRTAMKLYWSTNASKMLKSGHSMPSSSKKSRLAGSSSKLVRVEVIWIVSPLYSTMVLKFNACLSLSKFDGSRSNFEDFNVKTISLSTCSSFVFASIDNTFSLPKVAQSILISTMSSPYQFKTFSASNISRREYLR